MARKVRLNGILAGASGGHVQGRRDAGQQILHPSGKKAFNQTRRELQKTIDAFYFRYAEENGLSFAAAQKKLDAEELGELQDFIDLVMKNIGKYNQQVNNMSIKARITRYQALEAQVDAILRQLYAIDYETEAEKTMQEVYGDTYYRTWYNADQYHGFHAEFAQVNPTVVEKLLEYPFNGAASNFLEFIFLAKSLASVDGCLPWISNREFLPDE